MAGAKGSVDPAVLPPQGYADPTLVTFSMTDLSRTAGKSYQLRLGLFRTLGPTESVFVSGNGEKLDDELTFGTATVEIIPEPAGLFWMTMGGFLVMAAVKRSWARMIIPQIS
jgi:hypothetical protein